MNKIHRLAQEFGGKTITEHRGMPASYMSKENLQSIARYAGKILELLEEQDDLPDWCDDKLSTAKHLVDDVYNYVANEKDSSLASS